MTKRTGTCGACGFLLRERDGYTPKYRAGWCRRLPPMIPARHVFPENQDGLWPIVREDDWCGEYREESM